MTNNNNQSVINASSGFDVQFLGFEELFPMDDHEIAALDAAKLDDDDMEGVYQYLGLDEIQAKAELDLLKQHREAKSARYARRGY